MSSRTRMMTLVAFLLLVVPLSLASQTAPQAPAANSVDGWIAELMALQSRLAPIEERAMEDPALQQEQEALGDAILAAMIQSDSTISVKLERLRMIMTEAHAVNGDVAKLDALAAEAQMIQPQVERARALALESPEIAASVATFRKGLAEKMAQIAPESRELVLRFEELETMIRANVRPASTPTPGRVP